MWKTSANADTEFRKRKLLSEMGQFSTCQSWISWMIERAHYPLQGLAHADTTSVVVSPVLKSTLLGGSRCSGVHGEIDLGT